MEKKWIAISVMLVIICACVVMSIPVIKVAYTVKEPYTTTETYYVTESYTENIRLKYDIVSAGPKVVELDPITGKVDKLQGLIVIVQNIDEIGGEFWVIFDWGGPVDFHSVGVFLAPDEKYSFDAPLSLPTEDYTYKVFSEKKEVTKNRQVPKQRTVTKYRDVTKYKYISALEYLLQGET